jgi:glycosyltransferase involved in cell wall biosynthesis
VLEGVGEFMPNSTDGKKLLVFIIIPVHNRRAITLACLENLQQVKALQDYVVVVVDDGSSDGTEDAIRSLYPEVTVLAGDGNLWWTGAIALGMQYAFEQRADYLIWLNDDSQLSNNTLSYLVDFCHDFCQQQTGAIAGCQGSELGRTGAIAFGGKRKTWQGYRFMDLPLGETGTCDLLSGNLVCIPRTVVEKIGYPDSKLTPHYGGDSLYLIRAKKAGFQLFVDRRTPVFCLPGEPKLYPQHWLLASGEPLRILKLVFIPQSGLSWRVWLRLNWEAYGFWGMVMFLKKYASIILITLLRFLPLDLRKFLTTTSSATS